MDSRDVVLRSESVDNSTDSETESEKELMVNSRSRRITAGNRYNALVAQEEVAQDDEDEVAMLFAEGEGEDEEYNSDEGEDEADMSSTDDDDQGPNAAADDVEGEKEIQKEAKAERAKKRKADMALTSMAGLRKKPRIDPTSLRKAPAPKPSKRKERVSWLPDQGAAPGRPSLRKQTILHRAETHAKLKESEAQRLKLKAKREKREKEREAEAPKELTQLDRLAEAERVERRNAKSLNRWETMERRRAEEQAARLAALRERKLDGAVVTWYSSSAKYFGLKESKDAENEAPVEAKKRGRKSKAFLEQLAAAKLKDAETKIPGQSQASTSGLKQDAEIPTTAHVEATAPNSESQVTFAAPQGPSDLNFLTGIHEYASIQTDVNPQTDLDQTKLTETTDQQQLSISPQITSSTQTKTIPIRLESAVAEVDLPSSDVGQAEAKPRDSKSNDTKGEPSGANPAVSEAFDKDLNQSKTKTNQKIDDSLEESVLPPTSTESPAALAQDERKNLDADAATRKAEPPIEVPNLDVAQPHASTRETEPPIEVISTRNLVILDKFDDLSGPGRQDYNLFFNNRKTIKPVKHSQELCPITGLGAKYRDPTTGIGYANAMAYKRLQELKDHQFTWSMMLGCYVGRTKVVARGVPEGFLSG